MKTSGDCKIPIGLAPALRGANVSPSEVLARARLPARLLDVPGARIPPAEFFALWDAIRAASGNPDIGLLLAQAVQADLTEPLFLAILSAADVAGAIGIVSKYKRCLLEPQQLHQHVEAESKRLVLAYEWPKSLAPPQVLIDAELAFIVETCRRCTRCNDLSPLELHLQTDTLDEGSGHRSFFRCPIHLGAASNIIVFGPEDASRRFLTFNPQLLEVLMPHLKASTPPQSMVMRVRSVIAQRIRGQRPTLRSVGRELAMSARALQRALQENGTTFRRLLDEVRNQHARGYLTATSYSDGEVAFLLGFEDASSFYRAFRSWNGISPSEFRERAAAPMRIE